MALNLNTSPYFDNFDPTKKFSKILFKPGVAVQARELTQLQTILQDTIKNFGSHFLKDGARVAGCNGVALNRKFIKINDLDASSAAVSNDTLINYVGDYVTGGTSNLKAKISKVATGLDTDAVDKKTLYVEYSQGDSAGTNVHFSASETLTVESYSGALASITVTAGGTGYSASPTVIIADPVTGTTATATATVVAGVITAITLTSAGSGYQKAPTVTITDTTGTGATATAVRATTDRHGDTFVVDNGTDPSDPTRNYFGTGLDFLIEDGILFIDGYFVYHTQQQITLEKYKTTANYYVGVQFTDSTVNADADSTLNDPATGTFNFNAPGADRYKVSTTIAKLGLTAENNDDFVSLYTIEDGLLARGDVAGDLDYYNELGAILASRTKEESGNYVIRHFEVTVREHLKTAENRGLLSSADGGSANHIAVGVGRGLAYINGFRREFLSPTYVKVNKANTSVIKEGTITSTTYGNYILVDEVAGNWDLADGALVKFGSVAADAVTDGTYSNHTPPGGAGMGNIIGQARVRQVRHDNGTIGTAAAQYRLYLFDIQMFADEFANIRAIYHDDSNVDGIADAVLEGGKAVLKESSNNRMVFPAPYRAAKTLAAAGGGTYDNTYTYQKSFDVQFSTSGTATITVTGTESFPYSSIPTQTQLDAEFYLVLHSAVTIDAVSYAAGQVIRLTTADISSASNTAINFAIGSSWSVATDTTIKVKVRQTDVTPTPKNAQKNYYVKINTATNAGGSTGPWILGYADAYKLEAVYVDGSAYSESGTNYLDQFTLDNGQKDSYYGISKLKLKPSSILNMSSKYIVVKVSYFEPNYGGSVGTYFAVDSYPVDDTGASGIYTYQIPVYYSEKQGKFDLRDSIDFRPYVVNTASASATSLATATENPLDTKQLRSIAGGQEYPIPTESFTTDVEYYLPRVDKVAVTEKGEILVIEGLPAESPLAPQAPKTTMPIATIRVPQYPSLSPYIGRINNRKDFACSLSVSQNRRYTMQDIGAIEKRLNRLEYYTSFNMLETTTENLSILDAAGNDRFKNGIMVNKFADHNLSNTQDPDFNAGINTTYKYLTSNIFEENIDVVFDSISSSNVQRTGPLVTLPYSLVDHQRNINASKPRNCVGALLFSYVGDMYLYPMSDNFINYEDGGDIIIPNSATGDALEQFADQLNNAGIVNSIDVGFKGKPSTSKDAVEFSATDSDFNSFAGQGISGANFGGWGLVDNVSSDLSFNASFNQVVDSDTLQYKADTLSIDSTGDQTVIENAGGDDGNDILVDIAFSAYMRSQLITFVGTRLKPNTRMYAFFDGDDVNAFVRPVDFDTVKTLVNSGVDNFWSDFSDNTNAFGDPLVTDANGQIAAQFLIPPEQYRIGEKILRLSNDVSNRGSGFTTTSCQAVYSSHGLDAYGGNIGLSTQIPTFSIGTNEGDPQTIGEVITDVRVEDVTASVSVDTSIEYYDPVAQTFLIASNVGIFCPAIDVYFRKKSETLGVTIELREVVNGYPGAKVIPYASKYLTSDEVSISTTAGDGTVTFYPTRVTWDAPVYLQGGKEYAIVVMPQGNNPDYEVWVSELGENQVGTSKRIVAEDVTTGVFFVSSNNRTWNAYQAEDMMHRIYRCDFTIGTNGSAVFNNGNIDYLKMLDFTSGVFQAGDLLHAFNITLNSGGSGHAVNDVLTLTGFGNGTGLKVKVTSESSGVITGFSIFEMGSGYTGDGAAITQSSTTGAGTGAIFDITTKTGVVERFAPLYSVARVKLTKSSFSVSDSISNGTTTGTLNSIENKTFNSMRHNFAEIILPNTKISYVYTPTKSSGVSSAGNTDYDIIKGKQVITAEEFSVYSVSNEIANLSSDKSLTSTATMSSTSTYISPVIDLSRCGYIVTRNNINNDTTGETNPNSGNALCKFISKRVRLSDGQEAEDLRVYLDQLTPVGSTVNVYGKFLAPEDDANFREDLDWFELSQVEAPAQAGMSQTRYVEYAYEIDAANKDGTGVLEYSIDRVESTAITAGGSGYTGAPTVTFSGGTALRQASGYAQISAGAVVGIVITDPGRYTTGSAAPTITITGGGGSGATATASLGTATYNTFKEFAVKIVMTTSNTSNVPQLKNLRAIALQA